MEKLKIGFIGTGNFAQRAHYTSLSKIDNAEIVAICGKTNIERRDEIADKYNIKYRYSDYKKMLDKTDIDAVYAVRRPYHGLTQIACDVLASGKHLFIEKPPAISVADMEIMTEAAKRSGCFTMVGFNRRFIPILIEAKHRVEERGISLIVATFYKYELIDDWPEGKQLLSNGTHAVDTLRWLANSKVEEIAVAKSQDFTKFDNSWQALIRFENGVVGVLLTNYSVGARVHTFEIHGKGISAYIDPDESAVIYIDGKRGSPTILDTKEFAGSDAFIEYYGLRAENQHFVDSILEGRKPIPGFEDTLKTMKLVERIEKGGI